MRKQPEGLRFVDGLTQPCLLKRKDSSFSDVNVPLESKQEYNYIKKVNPLEVALEIIYKN